MIYRISKKDKNLRGEIHLPTSKSESNRALIIRALSMNKFDIKNLSTADDTTILNSILQTNITDLPAIIDVGAAGTAMRFLTAYFSILEGKKIITGSTRMKERPIKLLVEALRSLGAEINYLENDGFPPIEIIGKQIEGGEIIIDGSMSSQYLSALAMIAPTLPNGLKIYLKGEIISKPYLLMTLKMMEFFGVHYSWRGNEISISHQEFNAKKNSAYSIEGDWSSASYWYEMAAFADDVDIKIYGLKIESLQGDVMLATYFEPLGIKTLEIENGICLTKKKITTPLNNIHLELMNTPDIAQTLAVTYAAKEIYAELYGLRSLRIKETDRIKALINELKKIGVQATDLDIGNLIIAKSKKTIHSPASAFQTYNDHRMAMCLAPLAMLFNHIDIENPLVVNKSYPSFWEDLTKVGFEIVTL